MSLKLSKKETDELYNAMIEELIDTKLTEYDDVCRAISRSYGKEKADYIEDAKGIMTTIEDLLSELDENPVIIITEKAQ